MFADRYLISWFQKSSLRSCSAWHWNTLWRKRRYLCERERRRQHFWTWWRHNHLIYCSHRI